MKLLEAIQNCRKTKKDYESINDFISCSISYDEDGEIYIDYADEKEGYGIGHVIQKTDLESDILEIIDDLFADIKDDLDFVEVE